jgi:uncharacterized protein YjbI with pentapeptide repeats
MANQEHLDALKKGVESWSQWRRRNRTIIPDLCRVDLHHTDLRVVDLSGADLLNASLYGANMRGANMRGAKLQGADLRAANLVGADLRATYLQHATLTDADMTNADVGNANLAGADLSGVNFSGARLRRCELAGANFSRAALGSTALEDLDLSGALNLETVWHSGPSTLGLDTIYRSQGKIPASFLRGAGVPENFITYVKSLTGAAFEFRSVFISYSNEDQDFADRLHADLQSRGVRCWFAPHDAQGGRKLHEQIDEAIRVYDKLLLILSEASMNSPWVKTEVANARAREDQQERQMLFPITLIPFDRIKAWKLFDADRGIDSAREIREYFIPDFSNWKDDDSYQKALDRLLRDLRAETEDRATA